MAEERVGWEDDIKNNLREIKCQDVDSVHMAEEKAQWWVFISMEMRLGFSNMYREPFLKAERIMDCQYGSVPRS